MPSVERPSENGVLTQYKRAVKELEQQLDTESKRNRETRSKQVQDLEDHYSKALAEKDQNIEKSIQEVRKAASEASDRERDRYQESVDELKDQVKDQVYNKRGELHKDSPQDSYQKQVAVLAASNEKLREHERQSFENRENELRHDIQEVAQKKSGEAMRMSEAKNKEIRELEQQLGDLHAYSQDQGHKRAEDMENFRRELDRDHRLEAHRLNDAYQENVNRLRQDINEKSDHYSRLSGEIIKEKEGHAAKVIQKQNQEHQQDLKELSKNTEVAVNQLREQRRSDEKQASQTLERKIDTINQEHVHTLVNQAKSYGETIENMRKGDQDQINSLQKALQIQKTTDDTTQISPAAESAVRNSVIKQYEKTLNTEVEKNKITLEDTHQNLQGDYKKMVEDRDHRETRLLQSSAQERAYDRLQYFGSLQESEDLSKTKIREMESSHNRERQALYKNFGNVLDRQRQNYEHMIDESRDDAATKLMLFQTESELAAKTTQRAFVVKQNELIEEYEKKIADQKQDYEFKQESLKAQSLLDLHDAEKRSKHDIEIQSKNFEQRIAQLEKQNKERERVIVQNYQNELDKTRRYYELLNQKKS